VDAASVACCLLLPSAPYFCNLETSLSGAAVMIALCLSGSITAPDRYFSLHFASSAPLDFVVHFPFTVHFPSSVRFRIKIHFRFSVLFLFIGHILSVFTFPSVISFSSQSSLFFCFHFSFDVHSFFNVSFLFLDHYPYLCPNCWQPLIRR
jgi:hypothetical protein